MIAAVLFFGVYGNMNTRNQALAEQAAKKNKEYEEVLAEQKSYELGKRDIETLQIKPVHPNELFSQDTKVVKEIQVLESLAKNLGLNLTLRVSGSAKTAPKLTKATSQIQAVPNSLIVEGPFDKIINFVESVERAPFIAPVKNLAITALPSGSLRAILYPEFYIIP
jgi:hypothetical protein